MKKNKIGAFLACALLATGVSACSGATDPGAAPQASDKTITFVASPGYDNIVSLNALWEQLLAEHGYMFKTTQVDIAAGFAGIARGDLDGYIETWLPSTHGTYVDKYKDQLQITEKPFYDNDRLVLVASDRISTFDVVLPTEIPDKGRVLTGLSAFWFARTRHLVPNHLVALRGDGRSLECRRLEMLPVEVVVRGYLAGSGWTDYLASGEVGGTRLPAGLRESDRLSEPIVTPATKATEGHDVNITEGDAEDLCGRARYRAAREAALAVYRFAARRAEQRGILLADTKFEFGVDGDGVVTLADEAVTPDSSRFWPASGYAPGGPQPSFDKQFVRDWCLGTGWDRTAPGPALPPDVVEGTRERYREAFELLTGIPFARYVEDPEIVL